MPARGGGAGEALTAVPDEVSEAGETIELGAESKRGAWMAGVLDLAGAALSAATCAGLLRRAAAARIPHPFG